MMYKDVGRGRGKRFEGLTLFFTAVVQGARMTHVFRVSLRGLIMQSTAARGDAMRISMAFGIIPNGPKGQEQSPITSSMISHLVILPIPSLAGHVSIPFTNFHHSTLRVCLTMIEENL